MRSGNRLMRLVRKSTVPEGLDELRSKLRELVDHYKVVLETHGVPLPFYERPSGSGTE